MPLLRHLPRQILRGLKTLPHVGPHPGVTLFWYFMAIFLAFGAMTGSLVGVLVHILACLISVGSMVALQAYWRANGSDRLAARAAAEEAIADWLSWLAVPEGIDTRTRLAWKKSDGKWHLTALSDAFGAHSLPAHPAWLIRRLEEIGELDPARRRCGRLLPQGLTLSITSPPVNAHRRMAAQARLSRMRMTHSPPPGSPS